MAKKDVSSIESGMGVGISILTALLKKAKERGLPEGAVHKLATPEGEALIGKFVDMLAEASGSTNPTFPLRVNYDLSVESLVINGKYDWKNDAITGKNFPTTRKGEVDLVLELVHFNKVLTSEEVLKELDKMGYRPAELHELLTFGEKYPDIQRQFPVFALGSLLRLWDDDRHVPCLLRFGGGRDLYLRYFSVRWGEDCRFAAVRK